VAVATVVNTWARLMVRCSGSAGLLTAAQLGVGHGLGIIDWEPGLQGVGNAWSRLLTWLAFVYAAAVLGAVAAGRRSIISAGAGVASWITAAAAAGLGAAASFPLVWLPVRAAQPAVTTRPELTIAITIGVGIVVGVVLAVTALAAPPIARSVGAGVVWGWLFAVVSVAVTIATHREQMSPRLGLVDVPDLLTRADWLVGPNQMIVVAGGLAAGIAWFARRASAPRVAIALSGLAGPALIACAYVIAGPGFGDQTDQIKPYVVSLIAAGAGLLVSTAIAVADRPPDTEPTPTRAATAEQIAATAPVSPAELEQVSPVRRTGLG